MRAFVITGPRTAGVQLVPAPIATPGSVVIEVERVGICGTDVEFFTGEMAYLHLGHETLPMRPGHEWCGRVIELGDGVDPELLGKRVTGDTMLGCGACAYCLRGRQHVCPDRFEVGIRGGFAGALAERIRMPASALLVIPEHLSAAAGALVEPGGNALRAVEACALAPGDSMLVLGTGTIAFLAVLFGVQAGYRVSIAGTRPAALDFAATLGATIYMIDDTEFGTNTDASTSNQASQTRFDAVLDATSDSTSPATALRHVAPGGRVSYIGLSSAPSLIDSRELVLNDVTAVGILSASPGLARTIELYASGSVNPEGLVAEVISLENVAERLAGTRGADAPGHLPKVHIDPRL